MPGHMQMLVPAAMKCPWIEVSRTARRTLNGSGVTIRRLSLITRSKVSSLSRASMSAGPSPINRSPSSRSLSCHCGLAAR